MHLKEKGGVVVEIKKCSYELVEYENGEMVLIDVHSNKDYQIYGLKIVPEEVKSVFN